MSKNEEKLNGLAEKFKMAQDMVETVSEEFEDLNDLAIQEVPEPGQHLPAISGPEDLQVFTIDALKQDFVMVRTNVLGVINRGNHILEQVSILDVADMKASQLMALATLQKTLGENVKLLMDIYKDIVSIEKDKAILQGQMGGVDPLTGANCTPGNMNVRGDVHQQIVVAGNTSDLMNFVKKEKEEKEAVDVEAVDVSPEGENDG